MSEGSPHERKQDGLLSTIFTTYRGLATLALTFLAGMILDAKMGDIIDLPTAQQRNTEAIEAMEAEHTAFNQRFKTLEDRQMESRELLLDLICANPNTDDRWECRSGDRRGQ